MNQGLTTSSAGSRVRLIKTIPLPDAQPDGSLSPTLHPASMPSNPAFLQEMVAILMAIGVVVATRLLLTLSVLGAFALHYVAVLAPDAYKIGVCIVYDAGVVIPCAWLYLRSG